MAHFLTIDQGNTVAKLTLWDGCRVVAHTGVEALTTDSLEEFVGKVSLQAAMYCSVAGDGEAVMKQLARMAGKVYRLDSRMPMPMVIDYKSPCSLGADRVAAAVGAMTLYPGEQLLVVDIGTAVTYDVVTAEGHFIGGNIAPGVKMRLESLNRYTARLPLVAVPETIGSDEPMLGIDTRSALLRGALHGIAGAVSYYSSRLQGDVRVVLTGGDARIIAPLCSIPLHVEEHLVDIGLNRILLYNENN